MFFFLQFIDNRNSDQQAETMRTGMCLSDEHPSISFTKNIKKCINFYSKGIVLVSDNKLSFIWFYIAIGILVILLAASLGYIVFLKRHMFSVQRNKENTKTKSKSRRQNNHENYDNLSVLKESHQYAGMNSETNESHYQELPENNLNSVL